MATTWTPPEASMLNGNDAGLDTLPENTLRAIRLAFLWAARREVSAHELEATAHHVEAYAADYDLARFLMEQSQTRLPLAGV